MSTQLSLRSILLRQLSEWMSIDSFSAQEDVDYAKARIQALRTQLRAIDNDDPPAHVCRMCRRCEADAQGFLGFHGSIANPMEELCDDCASLYGCVCCPNVGIPHDFQRDLPLQ